MALPPSGPPTPLYSEHCGYRSHACRTPVMLAKSSVLSRVFPARAPTPAAVPIPACAPCPPPPFAMTKTVSPPGVVAQIEIEIESKA